ncbi:hypothetical protein AVEN_159720-1 [Araneus ventricosus]|uniref:Uncharacterized protein n=1 Tax=Araneus ventricosus TaxID=182803 RepID=A0A4Y2JCC8_ARAVE|nr:hypothetical protein AVEN_159720-1 [Araneus ventricosus]
MTSSILPTCSHSTSLQISSRTEQCLDGTVGDGAKWGSYSDSGGYYTCEFAGMVTGPIFMQSSVIYHDNHLETILFFNVISTNVDTLIPSFNQRPNSRCIKFFGLLSHPQQDLVLNVVIICKEFASKKLF